MENQEYIGFGRRLVAYIIDIIIVGVSAFLIGVILRLSMSFSSEQAVGEMVMSVYFVAYLVYFILMESSSKQATVGKMLLKVKVVNGDGERLSLLNAVGRSFGRLISGMLMGLGYVMILFTKEKQGLHDKLAKTYVVGR